MIYHKNNMVKMFVMFIGMTLLLTGCAASKEQSAKEQEMNKWMEQADLSDSMTSQELYEKALLEDTLAIYSVSSRTFEVKESFEREYPGLTVEIKDIRGNDVVDMVRENYESGKYGCDLIICSDSDGSLYQELIEARIIYSYIPADIAPYMKEGHGDSGRKKCRRSILGDDFTKRRIYEFQ